MIPCTPRWAHFGARPNAYFGVLKEKKLQRAVGATFVASALLGAALSPVAGHIAEEAFLLLTRAASDFAHSLCTDIQIGWRAVVSAAPTVSYVLLGAIAIYDLARNEVRWRTKAAALKRQIYRIVADQFSDCTRCAHMNVCVKSSYEKMEEAAKRCRRDRGVDLYDFQLEATLALAVSQPQAEQSAGVVIAHKGAA